MKVGSTSKIVACVEDKKVVPWHQALAGYATAYSTILMCTHTYIHTDVHTHTQAHAHK